MSDEPRIGNIMLRYDARRGGASELDTESDELIANELVHRRAGRYITIEKRPLGEFLDDRFRIPDYQREYEWEEEQWNELWGELHQLMQVSLGARIPDIFFGSMFFSQRDGSEILEDREGEVYDVIDGQQRLTTISIVLKILSETLAEDLSECSTPFIGKHSHHVGDINNYIFESSSSQSQASLILANSDDVFFEKLLKSEEEQLEYLLNQEAQYNHRIYGAIAIKDYLSALNISEDTYLDRLLAQDDPPNLGKTRQKRIEGADSVSDLSDQLRSELLNNKVALDKTNERLLRAYDFFEKRLSNFFKKFEEPENRYRAAANLKEYILNDFLVGYFSVDDADPQLLMRIFEVLNDRGVELKKTDVIQTRIVTRLREDKENYDSYFDQWQGIRETFGKEHEATIDFLTTFFVVKSSSVTARGQISDRLLEAFSLSEGVQEGQLLNSRLLTVEEAQELINELDEYDDYYHSLRDPYSDPIEFPDQEAYAVASRCNQILLRLNAAGTRIWEPIVLALYHDIRETDRYSPEQLLKLLKTIESLVIRFHVVNAINTKDKAYSNAVDAYHNDGSIEQIIDSMLEPLWGEEALTGGELVDSLCRTEWSGNMAQQVLRMIDSPSIVETYGLNAALKWNRDDAIATADQILPANPIQEGDYTLIEEFFRLQDDDSTDPEFLTSTMESPMGEENLEQVLDVLRSLVDNEAADDLEEISVQFSKLLGNYVPVSDRGKLSTANGGLGAKLPVYADSTFFDNRPSTRILRDTYLGLDEYKAVEKRYVLQNIKGELQEESWEEPKKALETEIIESSQNTDEINDLLDDLLTDDWESSIEAIEEELSKDKYLDAEQSLNEKWTYEVCAENTAVLLDILLDRLTFETQRSNEFTDIDVKQKVQSEINRKRGIIGFEYR